VNGDPAPNGNNVADAAALIAAVATLVAGSTQTIMARLDENSRGASERWRLHDEELARNRETITAKFLKIESALDAHIVIANQHFAREHDDDLVMQARVRPVRLGVAWMASHWKDIAILLVGILGFLAVAADLASRYLGGGT